MKLSDLKPGYLIQMRDGTMFVIAPNNRDLTGVNKKERIVFTTLKKETSCSSQDIVKVYGCTEEEAATTPTSSPRFIAASLRDPVTHQSSDLMSEDCFLFTPKNRELLWSEEVPRPVEPTWVGEDTVKIGYVTEHRDGSFRILMPYADGLVLADPVGHQSLPFSSYWFKDYLEYRFNKELDIMKVYGLYPSDTYEVVQANQDRRPLVWEREEADEFSKEKAEEKLSELLGKKVKINE